MYEAVIFSMDNAAFCWSSTIQEPSGRLTRWRRPPADFKFEVFYNEAEQNMQACALVHGETKERTFKDDSDYITMFTLKDI